MDETNPDPARADFARRYNEAAKAQAPINRDVIIRAKAPRVSGLPTGASGVANENANLAAAATRSPAKTNLLEVGKTLDPRFGEDMPQEIADAFANGDVQRIFRTSKLMPSITPDFLKPEQGGRVSHEFGDYTGSIYLQHKDGRIARFKNPEVAEAGDDMRHAGWKAKTAGIDERSPFFDQAHVIRDNSLSEIGSVEREAFDRIKALNPTLDNDQIIFGLARQGHSIATPTTAEASEIMGKQIFETMKVGSTAADAHSVHMGDMVSDIFESTGERHFFAGNSARGTLSTEPTESFISRRAALSAPPEVIIAGASDTASAASAAATNQADNLAATVAASATAPPVAPVAAVADAVVSSGASGATAAGSAVAAATAASSKVINIGKKIAMNPKTKIAAAVAVAGGIIGFRCF